MKKFTKEMVDKYAKDLMIKLSSEENKKVLDEFDIIEENMEKISNLKDIKDIEPMTHPLEYDDIILRDDEVREELSLDEVLKNTERKTMEEIIIPKVVEE